MMEPIIEIGIETLALPVIKLHIAGDKHKNRVIESNAYGYLVV